MRALDHRLDNAHTCATFAEGRLGLFITTVPPSEKVFECDCGYVAHAQHDADIVAAAQAHVRQAHGMELAPALILIMARPKDDPTTAYP
jgi:hypothetical protein